MSDLTSPPILYLLGYPRPEPPPLGNKAGLLHQAAGQRIKVPAGWIAAEENWPAAIEAELLQISADGNYTTPDPRRFLTWLGLPITEATVAVRSAFSAEDQAHSSMAGYFYSELNVSAADPVHFAGAICRVLSSAGQQGSASFRRDILVMVMIKATVAGVAFTQRNFGDDLVNFTTGTADKLVSGHVAGESQLIPKLESLPPDAAPFLKRLQQLLQKTRRAFNDGDWDIEWADDGETCWLIQIRPITAPPRRNDPFTYANIREIMPDPPSVFMSSIVAASSPDLYHYYRTFDRTLPDGRPLIELFAGRPLFNLALLSDTMRHWGLPTRLVTDSIGGQSDQSYPLRPRRVLQKSGVLLRQLWAQLTAVQSARSATKRILAASEDPGDSFAQCADTLRHLFVQLVTEMFNLTAALSAPLLILRLTDTLAAHSATHQAISTAMYTDLQPLYDRVAERPELKTTLALGELPDDESLKQRWNDYLQRHGHRGMYESDIARPRYHEQPEAILRSLAQNRPLQGNAKPARDWKAWLTGPVWWQCRRVLDAREWWRYESMRCYDRIRQQMLTLGAAAVARGQLPSLEHLWQLDMAEWRRLDDGWQPDESFWEMRSAQIADDAAYVFPDLLYRFDDLEQYRPDQIKRQASDVIRGVSLTTGRVSGTAWVAAGPDDRPPKTLASSSTILVARSVDAGWIPLFSQVDAVAVEIGGDLSHGSIILREIGLPAVTNLAGLTAQIETGDQLLLNADNGVIRRHEAKSSAKDNA